MLERIRDRFRAHPWLASAILLYALLSGLELFRTLLFNSPRAYAEGVFPWEQGPPLNGSEPVPFRWTAAESRIAARIAGPVLEVPLYMARPDMPGKLVTVHVALDDRVLDQRVIGDNGWQVARWFLPPVFGEQSWAAMEREQASAGAASAASALQSPAGLAGWFAGWQELKPWNRPSGPRAVEVRLQVAPTFVPAELIAGSSDARSLGVGVGRIAWRAAVPPAGIGFHAWETPPEQLRFRWTGGRASQPTRVDGDELVVQLHASHPDIAARPVEVRVYWQALQIGSLRLADAEWHEVALPAPAARGSVGILTVEVDRTWVPAQQGASSDPRALGVAMTEIAWREH